MAPGRVPSGMVVKTAGMEFFCYHRDRPASVTLRDELLEEHWSYMDQYQAQMIARGPTLDGDTPTGSVHILGLPDPTAARAFAFAEPGYQAGVYRDVLLRRWRNLLERTMWDFPGGRAGGNRNLVLGLGAGQGADLAVPPGQDELIAQDAIVGAAVIDGLEAAARRARDAAGDKDVLVLGAHVAGQLLTAGLLDEVRIHLVPLLPGEGTPLFAGSGPS